MSDLDGPAGYQYAMQSYQPRPTTFHGVRETRGWSLKVYGIAYGGEHSHSASACIIDWPGFEPGLRMAEESLPAPQPGAGRPGLGFVIAHQGRTGDYIVLGWWNNENELPLEVFVRRGRAEPWRRAEQGESVCVWDLEIIWAERSAWVETMLTGLPDPVAYLARVPSL